MWNFRKTSKFISLYFIQNFSLFAFVHGVLQIKFVVIEAFLYFAYNLPIILINDM